MFLLIPVALLIDAMLREFFTFQYVSINTGEIAGGYSGSTYFTFQYVSINTSRRQPIHWPHGMLYIPICFY